jgi:hypothetical protein
MDPDEALDRIRDAAALWAVGDVNASDLVQAACDLLVAGHDGPALRMLAAVPFRHADEEVPEVLEAALTDLDLPHYPPGTRAAQEAAIRAMATRVLADALTPRQLARWAHRKFGHDTLELTERLAELDDVYDCIELTDMTEQDVDADVMAEARRILHHPHANRPPDSSRTEGST